MMHASSIATRSANRDELRARIRSVLVAHDDANVFATKAERERRADELADAITDAIATEVRS
jgi:hypothetical protein